MSCQACGHAAAEHDVQTPAEAKGACLQCYLRYGPCYPKEFR